MSLEQQVESTKQPALIADFGVQDFSILKDYLDESTLPKVDIVFTSGPSDQPEQTDNPVKASGAGTESGDSPPEQKGENQPESAERLSGSWDWALATRDFAQVNQDLERAIRAANKEGGAKAVDQLWQTVISKIEDAPLRCPIFLRDRNKVTIKQSQQVPTESPLPGTYRDPEHPELGHLKEIEGAAHHSFDLSAPQKFEIVRTSDVSLKREVTDKEQETIDQVMDKQFDKVKKNADRRELEKAFTALATGDFTALSKTVYYAPNSLSIDAMDTFEEALEEMGFQVQTDGLAERSIDGGACGSLLLTPPGSDDGIRLSYNRSRGFEPIASYRVEGVSVSKSSNGRLEVESRSNNPELIRKRATRISEAFSASDDK